MDLKHPEKEPYCRKRATVWNLIVAQVLSDSDYVNKALLNKVCDGENLRK